MHVYFFKHFFNNVTILASEELVVLGEHVLVFAVGWKVMPQPARNAYCLVSELPLSDGWLALKKHAWLVEKIIALETSVNGPVITLFLLF